MKAFRVLGALALCVLPAACAQVLGVGDFSDQQAGSGGLSGAAGLSGSGGLSDRGGSGADAAAGIAGESAGGLGGAGGAGGDVTPCLTDFDCEGVTLRSCVDGVRSNVETCASDALCNAAVGECTPAACKAGEQRCNVATLERCKADLTGFETIDECASPVLCDRAQDKCVPPACAADQFQCTGSVLETCNAERSGFDVVRDCATAALCDKVNGKCVAVCSPGVYECSEATLLRCEESGQAIKVEGTCATAALCNKAAGRCDTPACAVNQYKCVGAELRLCNANRDAFQTKQTCATAALCNEAGGKCDPPACNVGQYQCQLNQLRVCNSGRTAFETSDTCSTGELCTTSTTPPKCQTYDELLGGFDGLLYEMPCKGASSTDDCEGAGYRFNGGALNACASFKSDAVLEHDVGGIAGQKYNVTLHFYGIVEPKSYGATVAREAGLQRPSQTSNPALPAPWAIAPGGNVYTASDYSSYEVRVSDQNGSEVAAYYVNSDTSQGHYTFAIDYERIIPVIGGGKLRFRALDNNCRIIKNCVGGAPCAGKARTVSIAAASPQPAALSQPGLGKAADQAGQWLLIDVVKVEPQ